MEAIGVFDSGVGGLTVLRALIAALPHENTIYLGDTARVPYGTRSPATIIRYAENNARALAARRNLKMLVVACNTVSAVAIDRLRQMLDIPVVGVIVPGAKAALAKSRGGTIAILGTRGTVKSEAYLRTLAELGRTTKVVQRACPLLVPLVEEGWTSGDVPERIIARYLEDLPRDTDTILLGCTHYPLLAGAVRKVAAALGFDARVTDGADEAARAVRQALPASQARQATHHFLVTDGVQHFREIGPRFLGEAIGDVSLVDL